MAVRLQLRERRRIKNREIVVLFRNHLHAVWWFHDSEKAIKRVLRYVERS